MQTEIKRWSNSAAVRLPRRILAQANLEISSPIKIGVKSGTIMIEAAPQKVRKLHLPFSEADLLKGLDSRGAHADELAEPLNSEAGV